MDRAGESGIVVSRFTSVNHRPPSSSGLGRLPFTQVTRVQIPLGVLVLRQALGRLPQTCLFLLASLRMKTLWRVSKGIPPLRSGKTLWRVLKMGPPLAFGVGGLNAPPKEMTSLQPDHR